jgi:ATP-binding cassette subfamily F protein uup
MKDFLFGPEQAGTPVSALSGGERGRLTLARALAKPSNLLVLDEPTNDLDLETLDLLEEMIDDYPGTVMLVSHDRDFLDRTVNAVVVSEGAGRWTVYAGGYTDMVAQRGQGVTAKDVTAKTAAKEAKAPREKTEAPATAPSAPKSRLTFKDKHALETLPATIARLETDIRKLTATIEDPALYAKDRAAFDKASAALAKAQADLSAAEDEWLRLEDLREQVEAR